MKTMHPAAAAFLMFLKVVFQVEIALATAIAGKNLAACAAAIFSLIY